MGTTSRPPKWIKPQLTRLVDEAPAGAGWVHEIKYDGYRMHARIDGRDIKLLTRTGLDWSHRYRRTIEALGSLKVKSAYLDGELCALNATEHRDAIAAQLPLIKRSFRAQACKLVGERKSSCGPCRFTLSGLNRATP